MKLSRDTLRGYILEEVLAYLIRNTGYQLLVDDKQDPQELGWRHNGLVVKGRGAVHQVDVLGELSWIPAFTYPLRLFVEAKFRKASVGIPIVRSMVGTLLDVNQRNLPQRMREEGCAPQLRPKYHYAGAVFSASGFSPDAMDMALAHGVSLIDLNTPDFQPLLDAVTTTADSLMRWVKAEPQADTVLDDDFVSIQEWDHPRRRFLFALRTALRCEFETLTTEARNEIVGLADDITPQLRTTTAMARSVGQLFVGMARGPFMLVLKADDPKRFLRFARNHPSHDVMISWDRSVNDGATWTISPKAPPRTRHRYRLTFRLPEPIRNWIFSADNVRRTALDAKNQYFSSITIHHSSEDRDLLVRMKFNPREIQGG